MDLSNTRIDQQHEAEGVWVPYDEKTDFLIARWLNPQHKAYLQRRLEPYKQQLRTSSMSDELSEQIELDAIVNAVLKDWKGLTDHGENISFSIATARKYLSDPGLSWLLEFIKDTANNMTLFREQGIREDAENVKKLSSGRSHGESTKGSSK